LFLALFALQTFGAKKHGSVKARQLQAADGKLTNCIGHMRHGTARVCAPHPLAAQSSRLRPHHKNLHFSTE
jgi:hypothetical protein